MWASKRNYFVDASLRPKPQQVHSCKPSSCRVCKQSHRASICLLNCVFQGCINPVEVPVVSKVLAATDRLGHCIDSQLAESLLKAIGAHQSTTGRGLSVPFQ